MKPVYLDIEVIPNLSDAQITEMESSITAPGNYKKPEAIEKWKAEHGAAILQEKIAKACFNELTGQIICISAAHGNDEVRAFCDIGEQTIIEEFFDFLSGIIEDDNGMFPLLVGHNHISFDVPYIWRRAKVLGLALPFRYPAPGSLKPWSDGFADTMVMWAGTRDKVSLDNLAVGLGLKSHKGDMNGSMVWPMWKEGKKQEIYDYCASDVELTRRVYQRLM